MIPIVFWNTGLYSGKGHSVRAEAEALQIRTLLSMTSTGHIAQECTSHQDTCTNCSEDHRTSQCGNRQQQCCISYKKEGHASWEGSCPEFKRWCTDIDKIYPENTMPYFPTDKPWTQVLAPPKPTNIPIITQQQWQANQYCNQDTLDRHLNQRGLGPLRGTFHLPWNTEFSSRHSLMASTSCSPLPDLFHSFTNV
jgi:hypothetical protein